MIKGTSHPREKEQISHEIEFLFKIKPQEKEVNICQYYCYWDGGGTSKISNKKNNTKKNMGILRCIIYVCILYILYMLSKMPNLKIRGKKKSKNEYFQQNDKMVNILMI